MGTSWFDEDDDHVDDQLDSTNGLVVDDAEDDSIDTVDDTEMERQSLKKPKRIKTGRQQLWVAAIACLIMLIGASAFGVIKSIHTKTQDMASATTLVSITPPPVVTSTKPATTSSVIASKDEKCPNQPKANRKTAQGAVAEFQKAYFTGDTKALKKIIASDSHLTSVDWLTSAGELVGSYYCVKISDVTGEIVDAETTVRTPKGEELLFLQTITTRKIDDEYKIWKIEDRPVPEQT